MHGPKGISKHDRPHLRPGVRRVRPRATGSRALDRQIPGNPQQKEGPVRAGREKAGLPLDAPKRGGSPGEGNPRDNGLYTQTHNINDINFITAFLARSYSNSYYLGIGAASPLQFTTFTPRCSMYLERKLIFFSKLRYRSCWFGIAFSISMESKEL